MSNWLHYVFQFLGLAIVKTVADYCLSKTKKVAANSVRELILFGLERLFKKKEEKENVMLSKSLYTGSNGSVEVAEDQSVVSISGDLHAELGGGAAKGVIGLDGKLTLKVDAIHIMDMGLDLVAAKFPSFAAEIKLLRDALDAEMAKL